MYAYLHAIIALSKQSYSSHHHLRIRTDDVWVSILIQVGFYIDAHAEKHMSQFVTHEGKERLAVDFRKQDNGHYGGFAMDVTEPIKQSCDHGYNPEEGRDDH
jgi:hypothetical protein